MKIRTASVFLALAIAVPVSASGATPTTVVMYHPANMRVVRLLHGKCWTGSIAAPRRDAFRCMTGNDIYDPCFEESATRVACPSDVLTNRGVAIAVPVLPSNPVTVPASAWAMELQNHAACDVITGAGIAGYPFGCSGTLMCSSPHKIGSNYTATCANETAKGVGHARVYRVIKVWF
jgi:hypothetical protein